MLNERKLTKTELDNREEVIMNMKKNKRALVKKYGKDAEAVMYGRATNIAKNKTENMNNDKVREMIKDSLKNPKAADLNKDGKLSDYEETRGAAIEKNLDESSSSEEKRIAKMAIKKLAKYRNVSEEEARQDLVRAAKELGDLKESDPSTSLMKDFTYDYEDIGQFYLEGFNRPHSLTQDELGVLGKKIVNQLYKGDIGAAYDDIVHGKGLNEGTWSTGTYTQIKQFLSDLKRLKDKYYDIVGSDDVFNGLDGAQMAAQDLMRNAPENRGELNENKQEAADELQMIMDQLYELSDQAKMIFKNNFPTEYTRLDAYGALDFGTSSNRYDVTLEGALENLDMEDDDEGMMQEGITKELSDAIDSWTDDEKVRKAAKAFAAYKLHKKGPDPLKDLDDETYHKALDAYRDAKNIDEDLDLGHQDNEPHMLKGDLYRIGKYAMELYQMIDGFEGKGEVDLPHWWQSKIINAKSNLVGAKHYLDFEVKEPAIDAVVDATIDVVDEEAIDEISQNEGIFDRFRKRSIKGTVDKEPYYFDIADKALLYLQKQDIEWRKYKLSSVGPGDKKTHIRMALSHKTNHNTADPEFMVYYDKNDNIEKVVELSIAETIDENAIGINDRRLDDKQKSALDLAVRGDSAYSFGNDPYADDQLRYKYAKKMGFLEEKKEIKEEEPGKTDLLASAIQKALNKYKGDESKTYQLQQARKAMNKGDLSKAEKIAKRLAEKLKSK